MPECFEGPNVCVLTKENSLTNQPPNVRVLGPPKYVTDVHILSVFFLFKIIAEYLSEFTVIQKAWHCL